MTERKITNVRLEAWPSNSFSELEMRRKDPNKYKCPDCKNGEKMWHDGNKRFECSFCNWTKLSLD